MRFELPPFVVWRVRSLDGLIRYRLVAHGLYLALRRQAVSQALVAIAVLIALHYSAALSWTAVAALSAICAWGYILAARFFAIMITPAANTRYPAPAHRILDLSPSDLRRTFDSSFPEINLAVDFSRSRHQFRINWAIYRQLSRFFFCRHFQLFAAFREWVILRLLRRKYREIPAWLASLRKRQANAARLRALQFRREDNCLYALSAFAAATMFKPNRANARTSVPPEINFMMTYLSPLVFGFVLCSVTFFSYAIHENLAAAYDRTSSPAKAELSGQSIPTSAAPKVAALEPASRSSAGAPVPGEEPPKAVPKFAAMPCVFVWFVLGLRYLHMTLRHDFLAMSRNHFDYRTYPTSMTRFAEQELAATPNIMEILENKWIPAAIGAVMLGLLGIYADFLHSL